MPLTLTDILEFLTASSGAAVESDVSEPADVPFRMLGYDSLTVLRTVAHIERTYRIALPENVMSSVGTPRQLLHRVNAELVGA